MGFRMFLYIPGSFRPFQISDPSHASKKNEACRFIDKLRSGLVWTIWSGQVLYVLHHEVLDFKVLGYKSTELDTVLQASIKALSAGIRSQSPVPGHCKDVQYWSHGRMPRASSGCLCSHSYFGIATKMPSAPQAMTINYPVTCHQPTCLVSPH